MIKKIMLVALFAVAQNSYAEVDFAKTCPAPNQIKVKKGFRGKNYTMVAVNHDGKFFQSNYIVTPTKHRVLHPLVLVKEQSTYDADNHRLTCDYLALDLHFTHIKLTNVGDY